MLIPTRGNAKAEVGRTPPRPRGGYSRRVPRDDAEALAGRIRPLLADRDDVVEKRMFGGVAFLVNGNMSVSASANGGLMLRCQPGATDELIAEDGVERVVMRGRAMDGWLRVDSRRIEKPESLERWVRVGVDYARSLPAKE
jgi:TfoX/Sxy family transcriptional regulator of competence genes